MVEDRGFSTRGASLSLRGLRCRCLATVRTFDLSGSCGVPLRPGCACYCGSIAVRSLGSLVSLVRGKGAAFGRSRKVRLSLSCRGEVLRVVNIPRVMHSKGVVVSGSRTCTLLMALPGELSRGRAAVRTMGRISPIRVGGGTPTCVNAHMNEPRGSGRELVEPTPRKLVPVKGGNNSEELMTATTGGKDVGMSVSEEGYAGPSYKVDSFKTLYPGYKDPARVKGPSRGAIPLTTVLGGTSSGIGMEHISRIGKMINVVSRSGLPRPVRGKVLETGRRMFAFGSKAVERSSASLPLARFVPDRVKIAIRGLRRVNCRRSYCKGPVRGRSRVVRLEIRSVIVSSGYKRCLLHATRCVSSRLREFCRVRPFCGIGRGDSLVKRLITNLTPRASTKMLKEVIKFAGTLNYCTRPCFRSTGHEGYSDSRSTMVLLLSTLVGFSGSCLPGAEKKDVSTPLILSSEVSPRRVSSRSRGLSVFREFPIRFCRRACAPRGPTRILRCVSGIRVRLKAPRRCENLVFSRRASDVRTKPAIYLCGELPSVERGIRTRVTLTRLVHTMSREKIIRGMLSSRFLPSVVNGSETFSGRGMEYPGYNTGCEEVPLAKGYEYKNGLVLSISGKSMAGCLRVSRRLIGECPISRCLGRHLRVRRFNVGSLFRDSGSGRDSLSIFFWEVAFRLLLSFWFLVLGWWWVS